VLLAEACNISLTEVAQPSVPALSYNRLSWISQNYVRAETIAAANELLLSVYRRIPHSSRFSATGTSQPSTVCASKSPSARSTPARTRGTSPAAAA
jgi:Tn3 transposase DDE domain